MNNVKIELLLQINCDNKKELNKYEQQYKNCNECVNKNNPETSEEIKKMNYNTKYKYWHKSNYEKNKEKIRQYQKQRYEKIKEKLQEKINNVIAIQALKSSDKLIVLSDIDGF